MNWKNVARLIDIDIKSQRLIGGAEFRRYEEGGIPWYWLYGGACVLGLVVGLAIGIYYSGLSDIQLKTLAHEGIDYFLLSLPALILLFSLVSTMMGQIQQMGVRASIQPPYWLPITWEEHTLASSLAHLVGFPLAFIVLFGSGIASVSVFLGELPLGLLAILSMSSSALLASITTEILRVSQTRFIGAIYKASGKAAIWVRFLGSLLFIMIFYVLWFSLSSSWINLIKMVVSAQEAVWFVPYVWPGEALASLANGLATRAVIFSLASFLFILLLFYGAVRLNARYGLYEPPAIRVSRGAYVPEIGLLQKIGFSSLEAALIRKDLRAFTRRRELIYILVTPLVFALLPLMQYLGLMGKGVPPWFSSFFLALIVLLPGAYTAVMLGMLILGEEGMSIWLFYSSPITSRDLVKCKYAIVCILSCTMTLIYGAAGILIAQSSAYLAMLLLLEALVLVFSLGAASMVAGIRGADFTEAPRPRMVRQYTSLVGLVVCLILAAFILSPLIPYAPKIMTPSAVLLEPSMDLYLAVSVSLIIGLMITVGSYVVALRSAEEFLLKAET